MEVGNKVVKAAKLGASVVGIATLTSVFYVAVLANAWEDWLHVRRTRANRNGWQD